MVDTGINYYRISGFQEYGMMIPTSVSVELTLKVLACINAYRLGLKSVDYSIKKYPLNKEEVEKQYSGGIERIGDSFLDKLFAWQELSKQGIVCGWFGCQKSPLVKCEHCYLEYCDEHKEMLNERAHKKKG